MTGQALIKPHVASGLIASVCVPLATETVPLHRSLGRVLRETVFAERDQPPFDRVAMDGIALRFGDIANTKDFTVLGTIAAGHPSQTLTQAAACYEVMTGAMLPPGTDSVVPVELTHIANGRASVAQPLTVVRGQNIHAQGIDFRKGQEALSSGIRLSAPDLAIAASANCTNLVVSRRPRVTIVTTGDELIEPGLAIEPWQVRRSNVQAIRASCVGYGLEDINDEHLPDDFDTLVARLAQLSNTCDVLILSGGVSAGRFDYVPKALQHIGAVEIFHKIAQRPGKPLWFGHMNNRTLIFGLPGNPVSTAVCMARYVKPAFDCLTARHIETAQQVRVADALHNPSNLWQFKPVTLLADGDYAVRATHGSGDFSALHGTHGCIEVAPQYHTEQSTRADFYAW